MVAVTAPNLGIRPSLDIMGLGVTLTEEQIDDIGAELAADEMLSAYDLGDFLEQYDKDTRKQIGAAIVAHGGDPRMVGRALNWASLGEWGMTGPRAVVWGILSTASAAAATYHGYKRNESIGWALWWGLCGALFPVVTPAIALAQGFGKEKDSGGGTAGLGLPMRTFLQENRAALNAYIETQCPECPINARERELWVRNDERLYRWARREGVNV
jgi:hypothetical protein